jgi:hypothetical protein
MTVTNMNLREGMRAGDLEDLVLPIVSVDEYESKVDDNAIVFALYVNERDAADDLCRFIQKSPSPLLDCEVSPAPDQKGYYMVFFEFLDNDRLSENVTDLLQEISPLVEVRVWQMRVRGVERLVSFSQENFEKHMADLEEKDPIEESIVAFLEPSHLKDVQIAEGRITLTGQRGRTWNFTVEAFEPLDKMLAETDSSYRTEDVGFEGANKARHLNVLLGEGWSVSRIDGKNLISHEGSEMALLLR